MDLVNRNGEIVAQCILTCEHVVRPYVQGDDDMEMPRPKTDCTRKSTSRMHSRLSQSDFYRTLSSRCTRPNETVPYTLRNTQRCVKH